MTHQFLRYPGKGTTRHGRGNRWYTCFVPTDPGINNRSACFFDFFGKLDNLFKGRPVRNQIDHREAVNDDEIGANGFPRTTHHLDRQTDAVLVGSAPAIRAFVCMCDDELV